MAPRSVFLMRHAEKLYDPKDPDLAPAGVERAKRLATWLPSVMGAPPQFIFACSLSKHSARPYETVKPLAKTVGIPINATFADQDYPALAEEVLVDPAYANAVIVICWHHGHIPSFARALKAGAGTYPDPWPDEVFNLVLKFGFGSDSAATVTPITEDF
jgi:phosphohistidine phosphatase SixA